MSRYKGNYHNDTYAYQQLIKRISKVNKEMEAIQVKINLIKDQDFKDKLATKLQRTRLKCLWLSNNATTIER